MGGSFVYCENEKMLLENLRILLEKKKWENYYTLDEKISALLETGEIPYKNDKKDFDSLYAGITRCEYLIARFGSVMVSSGLSTGRRMFVFPEVHIVIASASQVVEDLKDAFSGIRNKYQDGLPSQMTVITGPSRTADIEKTLVMGAHGPRELFVFMVDDQE
jgi:L-lactate dehydrogenase complex protein LldG